MRSCLAVVVVLIAFALPTPALADGRCGAHPWCDTAKGPDERAALLLAAMSDQEKISLLGGDDVAGGLGGLGAAVPTGTGNGIPRLDVPPLRLVDGPNGIRQGRATQMPALVSLGASFDRELAARHGRTIAEEARAKGDDVVYGPGVNIVRTPLGGRSFEYLGEDPYLSSRLGVAWIEAAQATGVVADVKHYALNNQEGADGIPPIGGTRGGRMFYNAVVDDRTLREIYLPAFEAAVREANVGTVMCAYNRVALQYACENERLLETILRREWGFKGFTIADYGAARNTYASLEKGLDFEPWPGLIYNPLLINAGLLLGQTSQAAIDRHTARILRTMFAYGMFDRPAYPEDDRLIDQPAHDEAARTIAEAGTTLLRNDGTLPLRPRRGGRIAVIGAAAQEIVSGGGSSAVTPFAHVTPLDGLRQRAARDGVRVDYDDGAEAGRAAALAAGADAVVVVLGAPTTEGTDRSCLAVACPGESEAPNHDPDGLVRAVAGANRRTVVVLQTGAPVLTPWRDQVAALVEAWFPGQAGGTAIARVLFGDVDPGGRLPVSFPASANDGPTANRPERYPGEPNGDVHYSEGVLVGYRWFDHERVRPAYPFGFGLSYTTFAYRDLRVAADAVEATVVNTGTRAGSDVAQLYVGMPQPAPGVVQPPRQLKGFQKVRLAPGASARVRFPLDRRSFSYWDVRRDRWTIAPGCYRIEVGRSSRDVLLRGVYGQGRRDCPDPNPPAAVARAPRLTLTVGPRTLVAGRTTTVRVRVRTVAADGRARAVRGARVAIVGRGGAVRSDRHGRARLRVRADRAGRLTVRASRRGQRPARAALRVR
ncbi:glycoside hydrolase family 3 C-terminal domain-containing protein [Patulibacter defluvii]|uniref:glycoside hydrolase family 3 C-terminal domain-containing protein n=1 Tax=Patulibacter defluvii TaxID=3095358 RepID=UPI002A75C535|nr:glycoside hydrolase family 3 C-terminal domain-containing protein [Patulibacter sp. DM4]